jgi:endoglucanase
MTRRDLLKGLAAGALLAAGAPLSASDQPPVTVEAAAASGRAPTSDCARWRGFNLHNLFATKGIGPFQEHDFRWIGEWGFNCVRIPVAYQVITILGDPYAPDDWWLNELDQGLAWARRYGLHVQLNLNRLPGHPPWNEKDNLWKDKTPLDAVCHLWRSLAERYQDIPPDQLSFNLINEPPGIGDTMSAADYVRVITAVTGAIRGVRPDRPINTDGLLWGLFTCPELKDLGIGQSCHIYVPFELSHYKASWMQGSETWPEPVWPGLESQGFYEAYGKGFTWDRARLEEFYRPWFDLAGQGVPVFCGETGAYNKTPHPVALAWLRDVLTMLKDHNIGWALWNFRDTFGILDSGRTDVEYEDFNGHKLDRKLLCLLQEFA